MHFSHSLVLLKQYIQDLCKFWRGSLNSQRQILIRGINGSFLF